MVINQDLASAAQFQPISAIDNKISKLTEALAALCLDQLENKMMPSNKIYLNVNVNIFAEELQVRDYIAIRR